MRFWRITPLFLFIGLMFQGASLRAETRYATIPLDNSRLPSDDLIYKNKILRSDEAHALSQSGVDLAGLNPASNLFWSADKKFLSAAEDDLPVDEDDTVDFDQALTSASGLLRFNARIGSTTAIIHLDKTLHTMLLRKNILRLMGYKIPPIKWLNKLNVSFTNIDQMRSFIESQITRSTAGAPCRWVKEIGFSDTVELAKFQGSELHKATIGSPCNWKLTSSLTGYQLVLRDVAVTIPRNGDYFNLALGTPPVNLSNRTWRATIIPYALINLDESANAFEWNVGNIRDGEVNLPHFTLSQFSTSLDDARWALNILQKITKDEFRKAIELAYFPPEVASLLLEKISSRRNSLMDIFKLPVTSLPFNKKISQGSSLIAGKLQKQEWPGFGSRFSWGDPESPFKDYHWYALAKLQAILMDNVLTRINNKLVLTNPQEQRVDFVRKQFRKGLDHFVETGEFLTFPVKTWFSPAADVDLKASRDVVVGNYMGTNNLVQIADSIGWSVRFGGHAGIENVPNIPTMAATAKFSINKTWSHLKPLRNLKQAMQEPYRNIAVPLLKWQIKRNLRIVNALKDSARPEADLNLKDKNSELSEVVTHLNKTMGTGESLLFTESIAPQASLSGSTGEFVTPVDIRAAVSVNENIIRRIQLYRKSENIIQVYDDRGFSRGWSLDMAVQKYVPIFLIGWGGSKGDFGVRMYEVNINPDVKENPALFDNAHALAEFLQTGSSELLAALQKPNVVDANFEDKTFRFSLLPWRLKKLKTTTTFDVKSRDGLEGKFIAFTDEKQTGWNWEAFSKDLINFGLSKVVDGVSWSGNPNQNPAETIMGMGTTQSVRFEASLDDKGMLEERFLRLSDRWEGWSASVAKVQSKMRASNEKFGYTIFNEGSLGNITKLKLFNVSVNLNIYENGIKKLSEMNSDKLIQLENRYEVASGKRERGCSDQQIQKHRLSSGQVVESCGTLNSVIDQQRECQDKINKDKTDTSINRCLTKLLRVAYQDLEYQDLARLIGKNNIFVHGSIDGFRNGDEILNDTIESNTEGRIGGQFWNGPFEVIQRLLGIQSGEFNGYWLRERL